MNKRLLILADRRRDLIEKIEVQRREMAEMAVYWESPLAVVDRGIKAVHLVQSHPLLMGWHNSISRFAPHRYFWLGAEGSALVIPLSVYFFSWIKMFFLANPFFK